MTRTELIAVSILLTLPTGCSRPPQDAPATPPAPAAAAPHPAAHSARAPVAVQTTVLGPFTGFDAPLHPDNLQPERIEYHGTDLGWSYAHDGRIHFIFGDTHRNVKGEGLTPTHDDSFGTIALADWPDPSVIAPGNVPLLKMGQIPGSNRLQPIDTGQPMEGLKTPTGAFSNGTREFASFITGKPKACRADAECPAGFSCDGALGYFGTRPDLLPGLSLPCAESWPGCNADTQVDADGNAVPGSGICIDRGSSLYADTEFGRAVSAAMTVMVGIRSESDPGRYEDLHSWYTTRFINTAFRPVADFVPERVPGRANQDYRNLPGAGGNQRVFMWGRPWFNGVNAKNLNAALYFAYADMPAGPGFAWRMNYYTGNAPDGTPQFSPDETDAVPVDLDATQPGVQPREIHDWIQHMSVVWIEQLGKWVMFYGGGISKAPNEKFGLPTCGIAEVFARSECAHVAIGNGALRMRSADDPWGPWSPPQDLIAGGDPDRLPPEEQYGPGGVFHHPACVGDRCEKHSGQFVENDYGWFYGANIIEEWTRPADGGVDLIWLASTWNPYRVIMLRTRLKN